MEAMSKKWGQSPLLILLLIVLLVGCRNPKIDTDSQQKTPPNKEERITLAGNRQIPYKLDKEYIYAFKTDKGDVGRGTFKIEELKSETGDIYKKISSSVDINDKSNGRITKGSSTLTIDYHHSILHYQRQSFGEYRDNPESNGTEKIKFEIDPEWFHSMGGYRIFLLNIEGPKDRENGKFATQLPFIIELPEGGFIFDNNFLGLMAYICSQPELKAGRTEILKVLSVNLHRMITIKMNPKIKVELNYKGKKIISYEVDMKADDATFGRYFITPNGVLLKAEEMSGMMLIELTNPDI